MHMGSNAITHIFVQNFKKMQQQQILAKRHCNGLCQLVRARGSYYVRTVRPVAT